MTAPTPTSDAARIVRDALVSAGTRRAESVVAALAAAGLLVDRERLAALEDRIAELADLPANWDSYGGRPMQPGIAERISALVTALRDEPRISLTPDGGGHLTWGTDEDVIVELNPDGSVTALIEDTDLAR